MNLFREKHTPQPARMWAFAEGLTLTLTLTLIFIHGHSKPLGFCIEAVPALSMAPHSSTLAWRIPRTEEPGGLQSMGSLRVVHD